MFFLTAPFMWIAHISFLGICLLSPINRVCLTFAMIVRHRLIRADVCGQAYRWCLMMPHRALSLLIAHPSCPASGSALSPHGRCPYRWHRIHLFCRIQSLAQALLERVIELQVKVLKAPDK